MPSWVKFLLLCCVLLSLAIVGIFALMVQSTKPLHVPDSGRTVAHQLMTFEEPLPKGWQYVGGADYGLLKTCTLQNDDYATTVEMTSTWNPGKLGAEELLKGSPDVVDKSFTAEQWGHDEVGGQQLFWVRGTVKEPEADSENVQFAYVAVPGGNTIVFHIDQPKEDNEKFDPRPLESLFSRIQGF